MERMASFGYWVRLRRKALDLTQQALARQVGCAEVTIKKIEADERRPSRQIAERLAECLQIAPAERAAFVRAARGELAADRLELPPPPSPAPMAAPLPSGTITFLFTDIEDSTELWEQHPDVMREALVRHDTLLRQTIAAHGGVVFKSVGDSAYAAFARAPDALAAAVAAQQALLAEPWSKIGALHVRMVLHTGVADERDRDYFGPPLNRAARLLAVGHGGQILLSRATQELVCDILPTGVALRDLGIQRLKDLARPDHIFQVVAPNLPLDFPALRTLDVRPHNLPAQLTPLIGRTEEVAAVCDRLQRDDVRLLSLTGPGGTGKTRLAVQVAAELLEAFADGVWFVDLAPLSDPALVLPTIIETLGLKEIGGQLALEQLQDYLRRKQLLLVLDNFEQIVDAGPHIAELLAAAPQLKALVTSRVVLRVRGEKEFPVPPLALPDPTQPVAPETLSQYAAVALFIQRAEDVKPDFTVTNANAPAVAEICQRLDGLPLAIELAATRVKLFTPQALLERLERRLGVLTGGTRDVPARQQTLRNTIDWSYHLLEAGEQALFARLGVFVGGCTIEAAEAVCSGTQRVPGDLPMAVVSGVAALVDKSLLRQAEGPNGEPRFVMLETIREYAQERLAQSGEEATIRQRHASYCVRLLSRMPEGGFTNWFNRMNLELDNIRAVLSWALTTDRAAPALSIGAEFFFWENHISEGRRWIHAALALPSAAAFPEERFDALYSEGTLARAQGDHAAARAAFEECQRVAEQLGSADAWKVRWSLAWCDIAERDYAGALAQFEAVFDKEHRVAAEHPDMGAWMRQGLAAAVCLLGDHTRARALLEEALAIFQADGHLISVTMALAKLGYVARAAGDTARARRYFAQAHDQAQALGYTWRILSVLAGLAGTAQIEGDSLKAARLFGAVEAMQETMSTLLDPDELHNNERLLAAARTELDEDAFDAAWAQGRAMTLDQAIAEALGMIG